MSKLKEINSKYYQECEVILRATEEKQNECPILHFPKTWRLNTRVYSDEELQAEKGSITLDYTSNHLYFLSDEEIKEYDYVINSLGRVFGPYEKGDIIG